MSDIVIFHNPDCGTSRNTPAIIRASGIVSGQRYAAQTGNSAIAAESPDTSRFTAWSTCAWQAQVLTTLCSDFP